MLDAAQELENAAALCDEISLLEDKAGLATTVLEHVGSFLSADMCVFRVFAVTGSRARLTAIRTLGVPERVNDAYLTRYFKLDPARQILQQRLAAPVFADERRGGGWLTGSGKAPQLTAESLKRYRQDFQHYRSDFLLPNRLYHHLGFCFQDPSRQHAILFDFHRVTEAVPFGQVENLRARVAAALLHAKSAQLYAVDKPCAQDQQAEPQGLAARLSAREIEVAEAVALGLSNKEIAVSMRISVRTVENHMRSIFSKLGVSTRTRLAATMHEARSKPALTMTTTA